MSNQPEGGSGIKARIQSKLHETETERIADGVWIVRGGFPAKGMNVYLIE